MDFIELMDDSNYNPEDSIREVVKMGYTREEAIKLLDLSDIVTHKLNGLK